MTVLLQGCSGQSAEADTSAASRAVMTVELATAVSARWPDALAASGEITPWQEAIIGAEISGVRLQEVLADVGDVVSKGQLLARYNEDSLGVDLARLDASVAEAQAHLAKAKADVSRADRLEAVEAMSRQMIESYRTQAAVAQAQLASAQAQREAQALKLRYARIVAPDDGVISTRTATVGAVSTLGVELFRLVRRGRLEWRAEVPGEAMARLAPGLAVELRTLDGTTVAGTLRQLSPTIDPKTRSGIAYVDVPSGRKLAAGMYVSGQFALAQREALTIPESAIVMRDGSLYVMRVDAQRRVQPVKVLSGRRQAGAIEILDGIKPEDRFVKSGAAFLSDGDLVDIAPVES